MDELIDFESGDVHSPVKWSGFSEKVRRLAAIVGLYHFALDGDFLVPQKELAAVASSYGAYDPDSTSTYLRRTTWDGSPVFFRAKGDRGWKVTKPGRGFVVETVKHALGIQATPPATPTNVS